MKMNMSSVAVAVAMVVMGTWSVLQGVEAQGGGSVTCLSLNPHGAPYNDANQLVQYLRAAPEPDQICSAANVTKCWSYTLKTETSAGGTICAGPNYCISAQIFGDYLNQILAQCDNQYNEVQGVYELSDGLKFFLTAADCLPKCINP